ncbi:MAG: hypothetical protein QOH59_2556 [Gemmatimonadales bacterium]|nr:hypothetical protein [Actinomycetota bacterium]MEA2724785.1 hypothetical protein [Gemmatimonadales bacterium]
MRRPFGVVMLVVALASCRTYDLESRLTNQDGLVPADRYARYGREQAQEMAIAREYGHAHDGSTPEDLIKRADTAVRYARTLPDVTEAGADPLGLRLTIHFKSGWLTMVTPIDDGKRGAETGGLPAESGTGSGR